MRTKLLLLIALFLSGAGYAQTQFWSDAFEDAVLPSSGTRTPSTAFNASNERYFDRVTPAQVNWTNVLTGNEGSYFWGAADVDNLTGQNTQSSHQSILWSSINITGKTGLSFRGLFAAGTSNNFDHFPGLSPIDYMLVEYRIDAGAWTDLIRFFPNIENNGSGALALETTGDSLAQAEGPALNGSFTEFLAPITGTGTTLELRLKCQVNGTSFEEIGVDNFRLFETAACIPPVITGNPPNRTICALGNTTFSASANGATAFQWQENTGSGYTNITNGGIYSGATTTTLTLTGVTAGMTGNLYRMVAINGVVSCFTNSNAGTLTVSTISTAVGGQTNLSCFGSANGVASVTPSGGIAPYTYAWSHSGSTASLVVGLSANTYTVTVMDNIGCTATRNYTITQPSAISLTPSSQTNVSCFGGTNGAAAVNTATGGAGGFTYNWTPGNPTGDGTTSISGLPANTWTVVVTDANSCTASQSFTVTQPTALSLTPASQTNVSCFGGSNGAAAVNVATGGAGGYTYNWTPGNPIGDGTTSVVGLSANTWTVVVTDANACTASRSFTVTQPSAISVTANSQTNVSCNGASNGAAAVNAATGGAGGYTYDWTPGTPTGDGTTSVTGLSAGTWTCIVTDANGCTSSMPFTITQPSAISLTASSQTNVSCFGGTNGAAAVNAATGGAGGYTYNWTPGNPTGDGTTSITGLSATTWTCVVTDANSCTASQSFTITQPPALTLTPSSQTNVSCFGGSNGAAAVNAATGGAGGYTYNWTPGNPTGDGTTSITGLSATTWTVVVTDANACTASQSFTVTQPTAISLTASSQTNVSCFGGSNGAAAVNAATGGAGGYTYNWTPGNPTGDGTTSITGLSATTWTCAVTDANGCTSSRPFTITQPSAISLTAASQTNVSCNGTSNGAAAVNAATGGAGGYTYDWTPGTPTGDGTTSVTGLSAGTWTCVITDANGCTSSRPFTITQPSAISLTAASQTNVSCFGGSNGAAAVNAATGGAGGYTYNWTPGNPIGDGTTSVVGLSASTWTVVVTDANACTASQSFTVTQPSAISLTANSQTNVSCNGGSNGAAAVNAATGGAGGYTYNWTPGNPTGDGTTSITGLSATTWTVVVTDANACTASQSFTVTQPSAISLTASSQTNVSCNGGSNGAASVNAATGGAGGYTYDWTPGTPTGDGTTSVTGLTAGTWTCVVTDANGCTSSRPFTITQPSAISLTASSQTNVSCNGASNGAAAVNAATGGAGGYTYDWTPGTPTGDGTTSVTGLTAGAWTVVVTDANACTASQSFTITQSSVLSLTPSSQTNVSCFGGSNGAAAVNAATGGAGGYTYDWTPGNPTGDGTTSISGLSAGTWTCEVTDLNGCTVSTSIVITQPASGITITTAIDIAITCSGDNSGAISAEASGGVSGFTYQWSNGQTTNVATNLSAGVYYVTATDMNGCTQISFVPLSDAEPIESPQLLQDTYCPGITVGNLLVSVETVKWYENEQSNTPLESTASIFTGTYYFTQTLDGCESPRYATTIEVVDTIAPVINCTSGNILMEGQQEIMLISQDWATATDNCEVDTIIGNPSSILSSQAGTTVPVLWTVTDIAGNSSTCISNIAVSGLPVGWSSTADGINCENGSNTTYDFGTEQFALSSTNCFNNNNSNADMMAFASATLCGNGTIIAKIDGISGEGFGWAGITMRENTNAGSKKVQLSMNNGFQQIKREIRSVTNGSALSQNFPGQNRRWLKIQRVGNQFIGFASANGLNWQQIMVANITMTECIQAGLVLNNFTLQGTSNATFSNVEIITSNLGLPEMPAVNIAKQERQLPFPNPNSGTFNIDLSPWKGSAVTIDVVNLQGKIVHSIQNELVEEDLLGVQLKKPIPGLYQIIVKSRDQQPGYYKVMVTE